MSRNYSNKYQSKEVLNINIKRRPENPGRYAIRKRAQDARVALTDLLKEANKQTGYKVAPAELHNALSGKYDRPSTEKTLAIIDRILAEIELETKIIK